jgi:putative two-component system response regulator
MNTALPSFVADTVMSLTLHNTPVAYLMINKEGRLADVGGDLNHFGLGHLALGQPAAFQALFLEGLLPFGEETLNLSSVELESGRYANIHLVAHGQYDWVILLDTSKTIHWQGIAHQKANELNLLLRQLAQRQVRVGPRNTVNQTWELGFCNALSMLPMEPMDDGAFCLLAPAPECFQSVYPEAFKAHEGLRPDLKFPFIENFLIEAREIWAWGHGRRKSGPWIETDPQGKTCALEAIAASWKDKRIFLIELLDDAYEEHRSFLQRGRENVLMRRFLEREVRRRTNEIRAREEEIALRLVWAAESRDDGETGSHIRRIGLYSEALAQAIGWERTKVDEIRIAATMHDIGKIGIPDSVLRKPGRLSVEEYEIMKTHPVIGGSILAGSQTGLIQMAKDIALSHHEYWNGTGYPNGLAGEAIPLSARIVAIADVFDALVHDRVYKHGMGIDETIYIMSKKKGEQFDPDLFDVFMKLLGRFREIASDHSAPLFEGFRDSSLTRT